MTAFPSLPRHTPKTDTGRIIAHPGNRQRTRKADWLGVIARSSLVAYLAFNILLLFSPLIAKRFKSVELHKQPVFPFKTRSFRDNPHILKVLADNELLKEKLIQLTHAAGLIQIVSIYQTSINTQQPSKFLGCLIYTFRGLGMMMKPSAFYQALNFVGSIFWTIGERNDIENYTHPGHRREWDIKRLFNAFSKAPGQHRKLPEKFSDFGKAVTQYSRFIRDDLKYSFSPQTWKDLRHRFNKKEDWKMPQSYQTAIGAQCSAIAWLTISSSLLIKKFGMKSLSPMRPYLESISKIGAAASGIIAFAPLWVRAWQSRYELDGFLTLTGLPLAAAGRIFTASSKLKSEVGIGNIGSPLANEGKRLTSKKYRALVNYLESLYVAARRNPQLTAGQVLMDLQQHPDKVKALKKAMGQVRVDYLLNTLRQGIQTQQRTPISFADFLLPLTKEPN